MTRSVRKDFANNWSKLSNELRLEIMEWALVEASPLERDDCSPRIVGNFWEKALLPMLCSGPELAHIAQRAFWRVNTFEFGPKDPPEEGDQGVYALPALDLCKFLRYVDIYIGPEPLDFDFARRIAISGRLKNVKHCNIQVDHGSDFYLPRYDKDEPRQTPASRAKADLMRWLSHVLPEGSDLIRLPCPGIITFPSIITRFPVLFEEIYNSDGGKVSLACPIKVKNIVLHLFVFPKQGIVDCAQRRSAIDNIVAKPWVLTKEEEGQFLRSHS